LPQAGRENPLMLYRIRGLMLYRIKGYGRKLGGLPFLL
jgi:hypothetical protein